jgi:hypothetical protein
MKEILSYEVWSLGHSQFIECKSEQEAASIATRINGKLWLAITDENGKVYCANVEAEKTASTKTPLSVPHKPITKNIKNFKRKHV